jgi:hypothetical protein
MKLIQLYLSNNFDRLGGGILFEYAQYTNEIDSLFKTFLAA